MEERVFGFAPSKIDGSEIIVEASKDATLPEKYSYRDVMPKVINQGDSSICVPCSISAYLNWKENLKDGKTKDNNIALMDIYNSKSNSEEGMSFKEAFSYLRHHGVKSKAGNITIGHYGKIKNPMALKYALVMNGPCTGALKVYSTDYDEFWIDRKNGNYYGGHAISIVGYDKDGFIIRNSWGTTFGDNGYCKIKYEDFNLFMEIWTIID